MRVSILKGDIGFNEEAWKYGVYLDGERIEYVFTADEERGIVVVFDPSASGSFMKGRPDQSVMKELTGEVRLVEEFGRA